MDLVPGREGGIITDPYRGGPADFAAVWRDVSQAAKALVSQST